jgi:hypothetical protein
MGMPVSWAACDIPAKVRAWRANLVGIYCRRLPASVQGPTRHQANSEQGSMGFHEVGRRAIRAELGNEQSFSARLGGVRRFPINLVRPFHALD